MVSEKVIVHCCCAHCAAYTLDYWRGQSFEVTALWYNPNIHPLSEHKSRLEAMDNLCRILAIPLIIIPGYNINNYFRRVVGHEEERCRYCFSLRLEKTAEVARTKGFDSFTTTLLISPHQKHDLLKDIGDEVAQKTGPQFLYVDLRKRYSDSRHITKPMGLYRQQYCGCLYSRRERYISQGGSQ